MLAIDSAAYRGAMRQGFTRIGDKFNRLLGRPRTERRWRRGGSAREVKVPRLAPGASTRIALSFVPERRGAVVFEALFLFAPDPLGLARGEPRGVRGGQRAEGREALDSVHSQSYNGAPWRRESAR